MTNKKIMLSLVAAFVMTFVFGLGTTVFVSAETSTVYTVTKEGDALSVSPARNNGALLGAGFTLKNSTDATIYTHQDGSESGQLVGAGDAFAFSKDISGAYYYFDKVEIDANGTQHFYYTTAYPPFESGSITPSTSSVAVGGVVKLTPTIAPEISGISSIFRWTVTSGSDKVELYWDEGCTQPFGSTMFTSNPIYVKGIASGTAELTATDNYFTDHPLTATVTIGDGTTGDGTNNTANTGNSASTSSSSGSSVSSSSGSSSVSGSTSSSSQGGNNSGSSSTGGTSSSRRTRDSSQTSFVKKSPNTGEGGILIGMIVVAGAGTLAMVPKKRQK